MLALVYKFAFVLFSLENMIWVACLHDAVQLWSWVSQPVLCMWMTEAVASCHHQTAHDLLIVVTLPGWLSWLMLHVTDFIS